MSITPARICFCGSVKKISGLMTLAKGLTTGEPAPSLRPSPEITIRILCSEPAAGSVSTQATGSASLGLTPAAKKSHTSPSYGTPIAMALEASMTLPPPTARTARAPHSRAASIPSRTKSSCGFGVTPPLKTADSPAASSERRTRSISPLFSADLPP